jgi:predicted histone-like DNA-binding protein
MRGIFHYSLKEAEMSLKYNLIQKGNPLQPEAPKKYYANPVRKDELTLRELCGEIAEISTVSPVDTMAVVESLLQVIPRHVANGDIIRLGDFGSFSVNIKCEGAESADSFTRSNLLGLKLIFRPGKQLKHALDNVTFEKA